MLRRAWTLFVGYMIAYTAFSYTYSDPSVLKFFPRDRFPYLHIGYMCFLLAMTEVSSFWIVIFTTDIFSHNWLVRYAEQFIHNHQLHNGDITVDYKWTACEIFWWYVVANITVFMWASVGEFYEGQHKKMFAFGIFSLTTAKYVQWALMKDY